MRSTAPTATRSLHAERDGVPWLAVIDGGPPGIYRKRLQPYLDDLRPSEDEPLTIDLLAISHIDEDHIGGIKSLLAALLDLRERNAALPYDIQRLWLNSFSQVVDDVDGASVLAGLTTPSDVSPAGLYGVLAQSVAQGNRVHGDAEKLHIPHRKLLKAGDDPRLGDDAPEVTILNPLPAELKALRALWTKTKASGNTASFVEALAYDDPSVPNLSSIVLLVELGGKTVLLTGDARGDHVLQGLEEADLFDAKGRIHLDVLKLPHHGSINNVETDFFEKVVADRYVISTDGVKFPTHRRGGPRDADRRAGRRRVRDLPDEHRAVGGHHAQEAKRRQGGRSFTVLTRKKDRALHARAGGLPPDPAVGADRAWRGRWRRRRCRPGSRGSASRRGWTMAP